MYKKKLIEVALPLEAINAASIREKSIRHGHPSSIHLWWARRPLATTRAVIWASLVDDPSSRPEEFPTEEAQNKERERLFKILEKLVVWENSNDEKLLEQAKAEIMKSNDGEFPELLDPFAGGGAIPLEGQRLGLKVHAHDLNPVPIMINRAILQIPHRFQSKTPVHPLTNQIPISTKYKGADGLSDDVQYYGKILIEKAFNKLEKHYPNLDVPGYPNGAVPIAWIWARTVQCPNPACKAEIPLVKSFDLSRNRGGRGKSGTFASIDFKYENGIPKFFVIPEKTKHSETIGRKGGICPCCGEPFSLDYVREEGQHHKIGHHLMAAVAEGNSGRLYVSVNKEQEEAAKMDKPDTYPSGILTGKAKENVPLYGMTETSDVFTNRQLVSLSTLSNLIPEIQKLVEEDAIKCGYEDDGLSFAEGGQGAKAYAEAVSVYLAFVIDQQANHLSALCGWHINNEQLMNTFGRQALPMVWDYAECNLFSHSTGSFNNLLDRVVKGIRHFEFDAIEGEVSQFNAQDDCGLRNVMISTDPPYYDNICYADLSDFFYVWMRNSLKSTFPNDFKTLQVPKDEELIASPYRFEGRMADAKAFFEKGMSQTSKQLYQYASDQYPVTIYYAFKQSDTKSTKATSKTSGWETMLSSIINAGFQINGTWPMRTEQTAALKSKSNVLATSIVLVCRKRFENAIKIPRRRFVTELKKELRNSLAKMQSSNIAPVDMAQSAIGPGMGVFSKYQAVLESDGEPMSVATALDIINQEIDSYFNEQDSDLRGEDRFCIELYTQSGFDSIKYGEADTLARAKNTSVEKLTHSGALFAEKGIVHLIDRDELPQKADSLTPLWMLTQLLVREMDKGGVESAAKFLKETMGRQESMKSLAYRLFTITEKKNWAKEAYVYNNLVIAWPEIQDRLVELNSNTYEEQKLF